MNIDQQFHKALVLALKEAETKLMNEKNKVVKRYLREAIGALARIIKEQDALALEQEVINSPGWNETGK